MQNDSFPNSSAMPQLNPAGSLDSSPAVNPASAANVAAAPFAQNSAAPLDTSVAPDPALGTAAINATVAAGTPSIVEPAMPDPQAFAPAAPGLAPVMKPTNPLMSPNAVPSAIELADQHRRTVIETVILAVVSIIAVIFIGLFIWKYLEWDNVKTDVDGQIDAAVALAVSGNTTELENAFLEREKYPYKSFMGPADYGSVSFEYPKTWNLYIAKDAANGGNYESYFNPGEVLPVSGTTINALRFTIQDRAFDTVAKSYEGAVKSGKLAMVTRNVNGVVANVYGGDISSSIRGIVTIFKVRDKTVIIQTDSELFADEYYKLLDTVKFVE